MSIPRFTDELRLSAVILLLAQPTFAQTTNSAEVVLRAATATAIRGGWVATTDPGASGGAALQLPDAGVPKIATASATPVHSFDLSFTAKSQTPYRLWIRGRAQSDYWGNDSVFVQFSGSVTSTGSPIFRTGTTSATAVNLEDCSGCGIAGWGWQDNGWGVGVLGPLIYFASDGAQTVTIQSREDGFIIDEVVLSPQKYLTSPPGALKRDTTILPVSDGSGSTPAVTLVRGSYLQQVASDSITIVWAALQNKSG
jgi:hypothetical protein